MTSYYIKNINNTHIIRTLLTLVIIFFIYFQNNYFSRKINTFINSQLFRVVFLLFLYIITFFDLHLAFLILMCYIIIYLNLISVSINNIKNQTLQYDKLEHFTNQYILY